MKIEQEKIVMRNKAPVLTTSNYGKTLKNDIKKICIHQINLERNRKRNGISCIKKILTDWEITRKTHYKVYWLYYSQSSHAALFACRSETRSGENEDSTLSVRSLTSRALHNIIAEAANAYIKRHKFT